MTRARKQPKLILAKMMLSRGLDSRPSKPVCLRVSLTLVKINSLWSVLIALVGLSTEEVSLFSTTCEMDKFVIRLNDRCRRQKYSFIDFEHDTFVWGDASVKWDPTQPDRSGNTNWLSESKYQGMPIPECPGIRPTLNVERIELEYF